jgi:phenylpyruvate C(3)-methyltransferase
MSDEVSKIFNSTIAAASISAAFEIGLLDALKDGRPLNVTGYCGEYQLDPATVRAMLYALASFDIVRLDAASDRAWSGTLFAEVFSTKGYFMWLVRGYGKMWQDLGVLARRGHQLSEPSNSDTAARDGMSIARASRDYGANFVDRHFDQLLDVEEFSVVADLGCGSAGRLQRILGRYANARGIGIDINSGTVELARDAVNRASGSDRLRIVQADVRHLAPSPQFREVDVLLCFFMGHDLWPRPQCVAVFRSLLKIFPAVKRFLFCDTYRSDAPPSSSLPTFTLGFEVSHAVMGQYIPTEAEWIELFEESGWYSAEKCPIDIPFSSMFDLRPISARRRSVADLPPKRALLAESDGHMKQ